MRIVYRSTVLDDDEVLEYINDRNSRVLDINTLSEIPEIPSSTGYHLYKFRTRFTFMPDSFRPHHVGDPPIPAVRIEYELGSKKCVSRNSSSNFTSEEELKKLLEQDEAVEFTAWIRDNCPDNREPSIKMILLLCADE